MTAKSQKVFIARIDLNGRIATATPITIWVGSLPALPNELYTGSPLISPILEEITGLGFDMGEVLPSERTGSIRVNVTRGTIDYNKRLYDYLETHTFVEQPIKIYSFSKLPGAVGDIGDLELEFSGRMESASIKPDSTSMIISVRGETLSAGNILKKITNVAFPNASSSAIGRDLPLIFGEAQEVYAQIINDVDVEPVFGYGTTLNGSDFKNSVPTNYYLKTSDGYKDILFAADEDTAVMEAAEGVSSFQIGTNSNNNFTLCCPIKDVTWPQPYLITAVELNISGIDKFPSPGGTAIDYSNACQFTIQFYSTQKTKTGYSPLAILGGQQFDLSVIKSFLATQTFELVRFNFSLPILFLNNGNPIYIALGCTGNNYATGLKIMAATNSGNERYLKGNVSYYANHSFEDWTKEYGTPEPLMLPSFKDPACKLYGVAVEQIDPPAADEAGLSYSSFKLKQTAGTQYFDQADLSTMPELIVTTDGIKDDSSGTITGTPSQLITSGVDALKLLYYFQNGNSLTGLDVSTFSPSTYIGVVNGSLTRNVSIRSLIAELLNNLHSKLLPTRSGDLALWTYGVEQSSVATIYESDFNIERIDIEGLDAIINSVFCLYKRSILNSDVQDLQTGKDLGFLGAYKVRNEASISLYGVRDLDINGEELNFIGDDLNAALWAQYKLAMYSLERFTIIGTLPFWENNYRAIQLNDIIDFSHIDSPSAFGSAVAGIEPPITTDGLDTDSDINLGFLLRRAKRYKMRVIRRDPKLNLNGEAVITFRLQVLNNPSEII